MVWKPKKKEPTAEELLNQAIETATPHWWNSEPVFVTYVHREKIHFVPTTVSQIVKTTSPCLFIFLDPSDYAGQRCIALLRELEDRYHSSDIQFMVMLTFSYRSHMNDTFIRNLIKKLRLEVPVTVDFQGHFRQLFKPMAPDSVLIHEGKLKFRVSGADFFEKLEPTLQTFIGQKSPGTPFLTRYVLPADIPLPDPDVPRIELGSALAPVSKTEFSMPGFNTNLGELRAGFFQGGWAGLNDAKRFVSLEGAWSQNSERIILNTGSGKMLIRTQVPHVSIVAETISTKPIDYNYRSDPEILYTECSLFLDGAFPAPDYLSEEVNTHYDGRAILSIAPVQLYTLFSHLDAGEHELGFSFQVPEHAMLAIYGLRFGR